MLILNSFYDGKILFAFIDRHVLIYIFVQTFKGSESFEIKFFQKFIKLTSFGAGGRISNFTFKKLREIDRDNISNKF